MSWREHLNPQTLGTATPPDRAALPAPSVEDGAADIDMHEYRPWTLQRGRGRVAFLLDLRRYEPRSGLFQGWQMSYPHLVAIEYTGDQLVSLDFGTRHFIIQGSGLQELIVHLQQGNVQTILEYSQVVWPRPPAGPFIRAIRSIDGKAREPDA